MQHVDPQNKSVQKITSISADFVPHLMNRKYFFLRNLSILIVYRVNTTLLLNYEYFRWCSLRVLPSVLFVFKDFYLQCLSDIQTVFPERIRFQKQCQIISLHISVADKPH